MAEVGSGEDAGLDEQRSTILLDGFQFPEKFGEGPEEPLRWFSTGSLSSLPVVMVHD